MSYWATGPAAGQRLECALEDLTGGGATHSLRFTVTNSPSRSPGARTKISRSLPVGNSLHAWVRGAASATSSQTAVHGAHPRHQMQSPMHSERSVLSMDRMSAECSLATAVKLTQPDPRRPRRCGARVVCTDWSRVALTASDTIETNRSGRWDQRGYHQPSFQ